MTEDINNLAQILGGQLLAKGWHISCAESCTGGGVGFAITSTAGSSQWFEKGFITYSNEAKQAMLGVQQNTLIEYGAVSAQTVEEMARGAAQQASANVAISVSGIAGPDGGTADKPVGTVWFGFFVRDQVVTKKQQFNGGREAVRMKAIEFALSNTVKLLKTA
ncbi:nicotinamide-nucleotide amidohydrolase family protein [Paraglaciecola aquimarina]|uniref:Nicotinamide-nucleotide amidohydrolase family protein n=1 Tax=Paraglaciecola aquimarina TaxID=1235557 RepID=A0ABU3T1K7_9ALTE|nr:nicotinamide-nucleotide amidohydrolase family protein [Paraglaciecola aquimarina]MDU0356151.1 nicotinamide-nucleotide amidohydrolase family protein [Paraglaciecola aquimarina]